MLPNALTTNNELNFTVNFKYTSFPEASVYWYLTICFIIYKYFYYKSNAKCCFVFKQN